MWVSAVVEVGEVAEGRERVKRNEGEGRMGADGEGERHTSHRPPLYKTLLMNDEFLHAIPQLALFLQTIFRLIKIYFDVERLWLMLVAFYMVNGGDVKRGDGVRYLLGGASRLEVKELKARRRRHIAEPHLWSGSVLERIS